MGRNESLDEDEMLCTRNPVLLAFLFYAGLCLLKTVLVAAYTIWLRFKKEVFATPEDVQAFCKDKEKKPVLDDEEVERLRRNQTEDLENEVPFILVGMLFVLVNPPAMLACWLFRLFAASRIAHTIGVHRPDHVKQPYRMYAHGAGIAINILMGIYIIVSSFFLKSL